MHPHDLTVSCPACKHAFQLTDTLAAPMLTALKVEHARELAARDAEVRQRETSLLDREREVSAQQAAIEVRVHDQVQAERSRIASEELARAKLELTADLSRKSSEVDALKQLLLDRESKITQAHDEALALIAKQHEIEDQQRIHAQEREKERLEYEARLNAQHELTARDRENAIAEVRRELETQLAAEKTEVERTARLLIADAEQKLQREMEDRLTARVADDKRRLAAQIADMQARLDDREATIAAARADQLAALKAKQDADELRVQAALDAEQWLQAERSRIRDETQRVTEERLKLVMREKDQEVENAKRAADELRRSLENKSQQLQGEVQELELEDCLRAEFASDAITAVKNGQFGADVVQKLFRENSQPAGSIIWESKRTKTWQDAWLPKLRDDRRAAGADIAVIASQTLPDGIETFSLIDGVWVVSWRFVIPLAFALRQQLLALARVKQHSDGQQSKEALVYAYVTSEQYRQRVEAMVEMFTAMQTDLVTERNVINKHWDKRQRKLTSMLEIMTGLSGDLEGIAGGSFAEIKGTSLKLLEDASATT